TEADLVLLDDAQLLTDQRELQSELLRLIDVLMAGDRQIVLAGDRPPEEIQSLDERLIRRFSGGLVIDIGAPDYETRLAILSRRAQERQVSFSTEVLSAVAELPITTVRELLGALNRLIAQQAVQNSQLSAAEARHLLAGLGHVKAEEPPPAEHVTADPGFSPASAADVRTELPSDSINGGDEFSDFLSDLSAAVSQQVDRWRQRVTEASLRYVGEGFRNTRLELLLAGEMGSDPEVALEEFERDIESLRSLQRELTEFAPSLLGEGALHDPDRLAEAEALVAEAREAGAPLPGPMARYTLELFGEGPSTRSVVEAMRTAASAPGQRYNPLVIVGPAGTGKTHLLHAFGHALRASGLSRVAVFDAQQFVDGLVAALGDGTIARWRQRLRRVDALLLDDVGVFAGKERSQEELYLLYNLLLESGRQMAFTASAPPGQLEGFEPRLATRLAGGLVLELGAPDREAKLREVARLLGDAAEDGDLIEYLAARPAASLRDVQQLLQRLTAAAEERHATLTLALARTLLEGSPIDGPRPPRRGNGLMAPGSGAVRSREKMVEIWPDIAERLLEEWR
ncbi:MAG: DnaA/Hda family protein, partial [Gemmatimonadales bacterium]